MSDHDCGSMLVMAMVLVLVLSVVAVGLARFTAGAFRADSSLATTLERHAAVEGAMRITLEDIRLGNKRCATTTNSLLATTIAKQSVTVACQREPVALAASGQVALAITSEGLSTQPPLTLAQPNSRIAGNIYFALPPASLSNSFIVENGDVWYGNSGCASNPDVPSIANLQIFTPERGYLCATKNWSTLFPAPSVGGPPSTTDPAVNTSAVPGCNIYFPGTYTKPPEKLIGGGYVYFAPGLYYFNVGGITVRGTVVIGGTPGASPVAETDARLDAGPCAAAATNSVVTTRTSGTGVTFVLGGSSKFFLETGGRMELFAPANGYSIIAYDRPTNSFAKSDVPVTTTLFEQIHVNSALSVHGTVWTPMAYLRIGNFLTGDYTGTQLLGGAVVARIEFSQAPPAGAYNAQVPTKSVQYKVYVTATTTNARVDVVADVRLSGEQLAIRSWTVS